MLSANATNMLTNTNSLFPMLTFYIKMAFVVAAIVTVRRLRSRLVAGGAGDARGLSYALLAFWFGAIVVGRLTAYPYFVSAWLGL